jgi:hypothetical protein
MKNSQQTLIRTAMSAQVLAALALMCASAQAQTQTPPADELQVSNTALDAEAIKSRVVITGSNAANRAPVQSA